MNEIREIRGITCCGDCGYYNWKKHNCSRGCKDEGLATDSFYKDCPLPKVQLVNQWIPCSERLPEEDGRYLCFWGTGVMQTFRFSNDLYAVDDYDFYEYEGKNKKKGFYDYDSECGYYEINYITAWMPLPAPYKEGGAE